jgi:hypothetical protein
MRTNFLGGRDVNGTGMRLFFRDAGLRQIVNDRLGLHFQVARQLVDPDLVNVRHQ